MRKPIQVIALLLACVAAVLVMWRAGKPKAQVRSVYAGWQPAIARVVDVSGEATMPTCTVEVTLPDGRVVGTVLIPGKRGQVPGEGQQIVTLYNPANP
jgi:hypothetical protein